MHQIAVQKVDIYFEVGTFNLILFEESERKTITITEEDYFDVGIEDFEVYKLTV